VDPCIVLSLIYNIFVVLGAISLANGNIYPRWFLFPAEYPNHVIGYSKGENTSIDDAADMFCFYSETIIDGNLFRYNDYDEKISEYHWYFPPKCIDDIKSKLFIVSSFISNVITNSKIELYGYPPFLDVLDPGAVKGGNNQTTILDVISFLDSNQNPEIQNTDIHNYIKLADMSVPGWINNDFWKADNYYYSVGMYTSQGEKNDAWKTAEERAFFNLITTISVGVSGVSIHNIKESSNGIISDEYEEVIRFQLYHKVTNGQVMERWSDIQNNLYYVLVRVQKDNIISPYLNNNKGDK